MVIKGVMATIATIPKASAIIFPPTALQAPMAKESKKVAVMGPEATPPESKAMAVKILGTKRVKIRAIKYPGINKYIMEIPVITLIIANPTERHTPMDKPLPMAEAEKI